jgi:diaminohydroxyphosphoribosylaminopyrimidine deaminase / 5-amino-6-(5-phosphoribosylamino)uracil reductase
MLRCIELASLGAGSVAPNPMVGAVLVHENRIIGEGYHQQYGQPHAEVYCIQSVKEEDLGLLPQSTLYVSLEPCAHTGKTPPCADLIIKKGITKVVIGTPDPFKAVNGKGIEKLTDAGVEVRVGVCADACLELNRRFFTFHQYQRPYVILKWAQTANGKIGNSANVRLLISNEYSNRLAHKWRSEEAAILVGTRTALLDNPALTNRLWAGTHPIRLVIDMRLELPLSLQLFDGTAKTIVFNVLKDQEKDQVLYCRVSANEPLVPQLLTALYKLNLQSVVVEGGARLLQSFVDGGAWDEARVIANTQLHVEDGLAAPVLVSSNLIHQEYLENDMITYYKNEHRR